MNGCPSCGVTVVSGYVKCPRCHAVLPGAGRFRRGADAGGTAVEARGFPLVPVAAFAIAVAVVLVLVLGGDRPKKVPPTEAPAEATAAPATPAALPSPAPRTLDIPSASGPDPRAAAADLERALGRQRLWSSVQAAGTRVEVRSGSCSDPGMSPAIDVARAALRGAGLTRLRCLAQSGAVVFERDL
ncbi:MAG TPA: hypothetical protein VN253_09095 [Kofleriaceae bacterium]|nr:hypothetical protein [Kofleriaceae bacterium]